NSNHFSHTFEYNIVSALKTVANHYTSRCFHFFQQVRIYVTDTQSYRPRNIEIADSFAKLIYSLLIARKQFIAQIDCSKTISLDLMVNFFKYIIKRALAIFSSGCMKTKCAIMCTRSAAYDNPSARYFCPLQIVKSIIVRKHN